jgi:hypothetical protein
MVWRLAPPPPGEVLVLGGFERERGLEGDILTPPPALAPELEEPFPKLGEVSPTAALIFRITKRKANLVRRLLLK